MFRRTYLGLDISPEGLRSVAVQRRGRQFVLQGGQTLMFGEGVFRVSARERNVLQPEAFVDALREVLLPLAKTEERVALAIPDGSGSTFLLNIETPLKSRQQSVEILKWQLKEFMPEGYRNYTLDYQILNVDESGMQRVLVSALDQTVLQQYEELMVKAGFMASLIDFHSFQLYNCYRSKTDLGDDFILVAASGEDLILLGFTRKVLDFYRVKTIGCDAQKAFREINRALVAYRKDHGSSRAKIYLHSDWLEQEELQEAVRTAFASEIHQLPGPLAQFKGADQKLSLTNAETAAMAAALGAAERLLEKVL